MTFQSNHTVVVGCRHALRGTISCFHVLYIRQLMKMNIPRLAWGTCQKTTRSFKCLCDVWGRVYLICAEQIIIHLRFPKVADRPHNILATPCIGLAHRTIVDALSMLVTLLPARRYKAPSSEYSLVMAPPFPATNRKPVIQR